MAEMNKSALKGSQENIIAVVERFIRAENKVSPYVGRVNEIPRPVWTEYINAKKGYNNLKDLDWETVTEAYDNLSMQIVDGTLKL